MKKMVAGLFAGLILATGAQAISYGCEYGACELPQLDKYDRIEINTTLYIGRKWL